MSGEALEGVDEKQLEYVLLVINQDIVSNI
jgi:hypothetical protein